MAALKTLITEADYLAIEEVDGGPRYELDEGELVEIVATSAVESEVAGETLFVVRQYLKESPLGFVVTSVDFRVGRDTIRRPRIAFYRKEALKGVDLDKVPLPVVPETILEIVSPRHKAGEIERRLRQYQRAGVRMIVMIYPRDRYAVAYLDGRRIAIDEAGSIEIPFLPGLELPLAQLFKGVPA